MTTNEKLLDQVIVEMEQENERLRDLLRAWWRNEIDMTYLVPRKVVEETIKIVAGEKE